MGWIDNDTVPRDAENTFEGRFGALGISSAEKPEPVAPGNDRDNNDPGALARRDGQRFVFLSVRGTERKHHLCDTRPGSTPRKTAWPGTSPRSVTPPCPSTGAERP
ncbi:hypothetical protein, partial [Streptomyces lycii]|uniref:hypothetical protein n=1 Tax=Streptomyces lycii TaxID=2654337 RepID=UPI001C3F8746